MGEFRCQEGGEGWFYASCAVCRQVTQTVASTLLLHIQCCVAVAKNINRILVWLCLLNTGVLVNLEHGFPSLYC